MTDPRIIVAIDTYDLAEATLILDQLDPALCKIKIGSIAFNALGKSFLHAVAKRYFKIFLDLKLHDIPNTVSETILGFQDCSIDMLTVHISGGEKMLIEAMNAAKIINARVIGVSILTSLEETDTFELFDNTLNKQVSCLFEIAKKTHLDGIVCSPLELEIANKTFDSNKIKVTPGIRDFKANDDQARTMSAKEAIQKGASFLVIGRPITKSEDIAKALQNFTHSIDESKN